MILTDFDITSLEFKGISQTFVYI